MKLRVMISVLGGLLGVALIGLVTWLLWERAILWVAGNQFRNELAELKRITFRQDYLESCRESGSKRIQPVSGVQLRFVSDTEFYIEPVCANTSLKTEPIQQGTLWGGAKRLYGPGIFIPLNNGNPEIKDGWVELLVGKTTIAVGFFNGQSELRWQIPDTVIGGESPAVAKCENWGFSCCQLGNTEGFGVQAFPSDCIGNCHQSCNQRPVILFFNSDPIMDKNRVISIQGVRATVAFGFEITDFDGNVQEAQIDFGDGEVSPPLTAKESIVSHDYLCLRTECYFEAVLSARDDNDSQIAEGQTNRILVIMQP